MRALNRPGIRTARADRHPPRWPRTGSGPRPHRWYVAVPSGTVLAGNAATISRSCVTRPTASPSRARACGRHFTNLDRPVFALVNLPETVKGALFARYSRYPGPFGGCFSTSSPTMFPGRASLGMARASEPRSSTSGSSSVTAMTRWRSWGAPTSPANGCRTCSRSSCSARGLAPTSSSPRATSPTTLRCPILRADTATTATPSSARSTRPRWTRCSRSTPSTSAGQGLG